MSTLTVDAIENSAGEARFGPIVGDMFTFAGESEKDFISIPDWVSKVTIALDRLDPSGTDDIKIRLGDAGGIESTGYTGAYLIVDTGAVESAATITDGVHLDANGSPSSGVVELVRMNAAGTKWSITLAGYVDTTVDRAIHGHWIKTLSGQLTQVRIEPSGSDTIDTGDASIMYE